MSLCVLPGSSLQPGMPWGRRDSMLPIDANRVFVFHFLCVFGLVAKITYVWTFPAKPVGVRFVSARFLGGGREVVLPL